MSTNRQKSFLATLNWSTKSFGIISHRGNTVPVLAEKPVADVFYFRCTDEWYTIYIRAEGEHFGKTIDLNGNYFSYSTSSDPTTFKIINKDWKTLTLDDLKTNKENVYLLTRSGKRVNAEFVFTNESPVRLQANGQINITLDLNIIERNAPFLNDPDEI